VAALLLSLALGPGVALATAAPGAALPVHARLTGSAPADGSTVESADEVVLTFNEDVNADFVEVRVTGPEGEDDPVADGDPAVQGRTVTQPLVADLPAGRHTVLYRVVSTDGHPVSGRLEFTTTRSASPSATPSPTSDPPPSPTSASAGATAAPSPESSPAVDGTSDAGPPTALWVGIGAIAVAGMAIFVAMAARADRSASRRGPS